jgi:diguanylate cyclase (GGDEF)-like protein
MSYRLFSEILQKFDILGRFDPQLEKEYMDQKFHDTRIMVMLVGFASSALAVGLWSWDWVIDPLAADRVLSSRLLLGTILICYPLSIVAGLKRKYLPWVYIFAVLITEGFFLHHLSLLETGLVYGIAGFMYWFILPVFLGLPYPPLITILCFISVGLIPNVLVPLGISPSFELIKYNALIWPTCAIGIFITLLLDQLYRQIFLYRHTAEVLAHFDSLTGIANRRHFMAACESLLELCRRNENPVSIIMLDIDHFKNINDNYGHLSGDMVLCQVSDILKDSVRKSDFLGRYGGEEFVIILPKTGPDDALQVAEKIRRIIESSPIKINADVTLNITLSAGVSGSNAATQGILLQDILKWADDALYQAKRSGRNRVATAQSTNER